MARMTVWQAVTALNECRVGLPQRIFKLPDSPSEALFQLARRVAGMPGHVWFRDVGQSFIMGSVVDTGYLVADLARANAALDAIGEAAEEYGIRWWEIQPG